MEEQDGTIRRLWGSVGPMAYMTITGVNDKHRSVQDGGGYCVLLRTQTGLIVFVTVGVKVDRDECRRYLGRAHRLATCSMTRGAAVIVVGGNRRGLWRSRTVAGLETHDPCHRRVTFLVPPTMDEDSEMSQIFPGEDSVDLYAVLSLKSDASQEDIRKSYRKLALVCHPDKHVGSSEHDRARALTRFQQIGFAYAVLSDEKRRKKYDRTGIAGEGLVDPDDDGGWDAYFQDLFDRVTRGRLDEMKKEYQGSHQTDDSPSVDLMPFQPQVLQKRSRISWRHTTTRRAPLMKS